MVETPASKIYPFLVLEAVMAWPMILKSMGHRVLRSRKILKMKQSFGIDLQIGSSGDEKKRTGVRK